MQEKPENNRRIRNNGTIRAGNNQIWVMDGKTGKKFIWSGVTLTYTHASVNSVTFSAHIIWIN